MICQIPPYGDFATEVMIYFFLSWHKYFSNFLLNLPEYVPWFMPAHYFIIYLIYKNVNLGKILLLWLFMLTEILFIWIRKKIKIFVMHQATCSDFDCILKFLYDNIFHLIIAGIAWRSWGTRHRSVLFRNSPKWDSVWFCSWVSVVVQSITLASMSAPWNSHALNYGISNLVFFIGCIQRWWAVRILKN